MVRVITLTLLALIGATTAQAQIPAPAARQFEKAGLGQSLYRRYLDLRASPAETVEQAEHLIAQARALLAQDPEFAPAYMLLGRGLYNLGRRRANDAAAFAEARQAFDAALKLDPQLLAASHELAILVHRQGRAAEARAIYHASFGEFLTGIAYLNWRLGRLAEAHRWIMLAADRDRVTASWQDYRARIATWLADYPEAITIYSALIRGPAGRLAHRVALSQLHLAAGDRDAARAVAAEHFSLVDGGRGVGTDFEDAAGLALLHGDEERALKWARKVVEDRPEEVLGRLYPAHLIRRSDPQAAAMQVEQARKIVTAQIRDGSQDWRQRVELGAVQASSGDTAAALASLREAVERGWRDSLMLELNPLFQPLRSRLDFQVILRLIRAKVSVERMALAYPAPP